MLQSTFSRTVAWLLVIYLLLTVFWSSMNGMRLAYFSANSLLDITRVKGFCKIGKKQIGKNQNYNIMFNATGNYFYAKIGFIVVFMRSRSITEIHIQTSKIFKYTILRVSYNNIVRYLSNKRNMGINLK